jgi:hypothetical protein
MLDLRWAMELELATGSQWAMKLELATGSQWAMALALRRLLHNSPVEPQEKGNQQLQLLGLCHAVGGEKVEICS